MVAPLKLTVPVPAVAVIVPPSHEPVRPLGVWTRRLAGKVSVKPTPVSGLEPGLVMVNDNVEVCPIETVLGLNDLAIVGGIAGAVTVSVAVAGLASSEVIRLQPEIGVEVVLFFTPAVLAVTSTLIVHCAPPARYAPVPFPIPQHTGSDPKLSVLDPAVATTVEGVVPSASLQVVEPFGGVATTTPEGNVSENSISEREGVHLTPASTAVIVKISVDMLPVVIELGEKPFAMA